MSKPSLNESLGLVAPKGNTPRSITTHKIENSYFFELEQSLRPNIVRFRWCIGVAIALLACTPSPVLAIMLAAAYIGCEYFYRKFERMEFVFKDLQSDPSTERVRSGKVLLCYEEKLVLVYRLSSQEITIIPAELIAEAKTESVSIKNSDQNLVIRLTDNQWITFHGSDVNYDIESRIRIMNPNLLKRKWWQF
jgi:hypothetical protein